MKVLKKAGKIGLSLIIGLVLGLVAVTMFQMYKPVIDASKRIDEVKQYAMTVDDELVNKDVKIIGLGEAAHGNKEFQELKLDVFKTLIRDNGVGAIAFEMDYGEGVLINDYIHGNLNMDSEELFSHISFELYHTEDMKNLIEWMKKYNAESKDGQLNFYGFDIQNPEVDLYVIDQFVKDHHIQLESGVITAFLAGEFTFKDEKMNGVFDSLKTYKEVLSDEKYADETGIDQVLKCIDNVFTAKALIEASEEDDAGYGRFRDQAMADNVMDIYYAEGYPIMITGHNGHVGYAGSYVKTMGAYLREALGEDYYVIGTDYFVTKDSIKADKGRKNHRVYSADPLAYQAKELGTYYLRFEDVKDNETLKGIVTGKMATGSLGEGFSFLNNIFPATVRIYAPPTDLYDAMIFVYKATPLNLLKY